MTEILLPLSGVRVLLVEDEPLIAMMLEEFVSELGGCACITTRSTLEALDAIDREEVEVAIVDVTLDSNGPSFDVADRLSDRRIPFVFSTGGSLSEMPERHRAVPCLTKPYGLDDLARVIQRPTSNDLD